MIKIDYEKLFKYYLSKINNLNIPHDKLIITFSGVTASGKSTVARFLSKKTKGLYISTDEQRKTLLELWPGLSKKSLQKAILGFVPAFQNKLIKYPNKLHILDANIDTHYEKVFQIYKWGFLYTS